MPTAIDKEEMLTFIQMFNLSDVSFHVYWTPKAWPSLCCLLELMSKTQTLKIYHVLFPSSHSSAPHPSPLFFLIFFLTFS